MSKMQAYRALMPSHYTPRRGADDKPLTDLEGSRKWVATRLPTIRVFGAFWSFGFHVHEMPKQAEWPSAKAPSLRGLRTLAEAARGVENAPLSKVHYPVLLTARVVSFLQVAAPPKRDLKESRMSLLAISTIAPRRISADGELLAFDPDDFPVAHQAAIAGGASPPGTTLIIAPFGDPQPRPHKDFRLDAAGHPTEVDAVDAQHLPAMQLLHGRVAFAPPAAYLAKVRERLGLAVPNGVADGETMVLLPDGFALAGAIEVPWLLPARRGHESRVSGWLKVTFRSLAQDQASPDGNSDLQPVLRPWLDVDGDGAVERARWAGVIARFDALVRTAGSAPQAPRWLGLQPNERLSAEQFCWPLAYENDGGDEVPLLHRPQRDRVIVDGSVLLARLADRPQTKEPVSTITMEPGAFVVFTSGNGFSIESESDSEGTTKPAPDVMTAGYRYDPALSPTESISLATLGADGNTRPQVRLAVPMIETADRLRQAMALPRQAAAPASGHGPELPLLWTFTPLDEGWLHWPLPNATPGFLSRYVDLGESNVPAEPAPNPDEASDGISGALMFGNRADDPGHAADQRSWSLSLGEPRYGALSARFAFDGEEAARYIEARVTLRQFSLAFDGLIPVTPFRQTPERSLPDHAERALTGFGLAAVSPSNLNAIERELWYDDEGDVPRIAVTLDTPVILAADEDRSHFQAGLSWRCTLPGATSLEAPWIWVRHATLPAVQTLPLAAAGRARNVPAEARSLAPLAFHGGHDAGQFVYACTPLDMKRPGLALDPRVPASVGAGPFVRPPFWRMSKDAPPADTAWRDEIGMAITTLPSLTLFAGVADAPGVALADGQAWSSYPSGKLFVEPRHDIALRDSFYAFAVAPPPSTPPRPGGLNAPEPMPALFAPRADNAPSRVERRPAPNGEPESHVVTNGHDAVWSEATRKAALAALEARALLAFDKKGRPELVGVFGEVAYPVGQIAFDDSVEGTRAAPSRIGAWGLKGVEGVAPGELAFTGLPQLGDLAGLGGSFLRGQTNIRVQHGTAVLESGDEGFVDQYGLDIGPPRLVGADGVLPLILKRATCRTSRRTHELVTLTRRVEVEGHDDLWFSCTDAPADQSGEGGKSFLAEYADTVLRLEGASLDNDAFAGFRWSLIGLGPVKGPVVIDDLVFEPLTLRALELTNELTLLSLELGGRVLLPVGDATDRVLPRAGGTAIVTFTLTPTGKLAAKLVASGLVWPLVDPQTAKGFVPTLSIASLSSGQKEVAATLEFGFADAVFTIAVPLSRPENQAGPLAGEVAGMSPPNSHDGVVESGPLKLTIGRARAARGGIPELVEPHVASIDLCARLGWSDARVVIPITYDLLARRDPAQLTEGLAFEGLSGAIGIEPDPAGAAGAAAVHFAFGADHLALRWRLSEAARELPTFMLDAFTVTAAHGGCIASLRLLAKAGASTSLPQFDIVGLESEALFALETASTGRPPAKQALQLAYRSRPRERAPLYRLHGKLQLENAFSWPSLSVTSRDEWFEHARLSPGPQPLRITHRAVLDFLWDALQPGLEPGSWQVAATVAHRLERDAAQWTLQSHQLVELMPRAAFVARLASLATPVGDEGKPPALRKQDSGFSPLVGPAGSPLTGYAAVPHFLHVTASGPAGLSGPLADALRRVIAIDPAGEEARFLAVDLSSHLLLDFSAGGSAPQLGELILASLPAIAFRPGGDVPLPWESPADEQAHEAGQTQDWHAQLREAVREMFACGVGAETEILQPASDGLGARSLPGPERAIAARWVRSADDPEGESPANTWLAANGSEPSHRSVFQAVVLRREGRAWQPAWDLPAASTAMHLSALLAVAPRDLRPFAVGFRPFGGIAGIDLFAAPATRPLSAITRVNLEDYRHGMQRFRARLLNDFIPAPLAETLTEPDPAATRSVTLRLVARARDGDRQRVIAELRENLTQLQLDELYSRAAEWGRSSLERLAPWATVGFAFTEVDRAPEARGSLIVRSSAVRKARATAPRAISSAAPLPVAQRQRETVARLASAEHRVVAGYVPIDAGPRLFVSERAGGDGESAAFDPRLSARGVAMSWALAAGSGASLGLEVGVETEHWESRKEVDAAYWITDRHLTAFRRPAPPGSDRITSALPADYGAELAASRVPANHVAPVNAAVRPAGGKDRTTQTYAPAFVTTSRISFRAGALTATRTGLVAAVQTPHLPRRVFDASQTPLILRQPRPPLLARNDRARASSHEPRPFQLSREPTAILHGPRAASFGASGLPVGLDRTPRSRFALRLVLKSPSFGVAGPDWDGRVRLRIDADGKLPAIYGDAKHSAWTVKSAAINIGSDRYAWQPAADDSIAIGQAAGSAAVQLEAVLINFRGRPAALSTEQNVRDALRRAAPGTPAALEVTLEHRRDQDSADAGTPLLRQLRFDLLGGAGGAAVPGVEAPLYFRFDDPEYNDRLQGLAKLARAASPSVEGDEFIFAADVSKMLPAQRIELALAIRPVTSGAKVSETFRANAAGWLTYAGRRVLLKVERQRGGQDLATPLEGTADAVVVDGAKRTDDVVAAGDSLPFCLNAPSGTTTVFHAMRLDSALLRTGDADGGLVLRPGDQLQLVLDLEATTEQSKPLTLLVLRFEVVAVPNLPANESSFCMLKYRPQTSATPAAVEAHLYAAAPEATIIELVDPLDLVEGIVRRRAIFQWRSFVCASDLTGSTPPRFALQKIAGSGGTWLPGDQGWFEPEFGGSL